MSRSLYCVVIASTAFVVGCVPGPPDAKVEVEAQPKPEAPPIDFTGWPALTPEPVRVPLHTFSFCIVTPEQKRLGPHFVPSARYYTNPAGLDAVKRGSAPVPEGTTILKEKLYLDKDGKELRPSHYAAMIKREPGYNPNDGDWEYLYAYKAESGTGWKVDRGKLDNCITCHRQAKSTDFLFRTYLK
jgi:hypothetical protein